MSLARHDYDAPATVVQTSSYARATDLVIEATAAAVKARSGSDTGAWVDHSQYLCGDVDGCLA